MTDLPGVDAWMPEGLCGRARGTRALARLTGPDTPVADDLPAFVERLADALNASSRAVWNAAGQRSRTAA